MPIYKRPVDEKIRDMMMYRGYQATQRTAQTTKFEQKFEDGFTVEVVWTHIMTPAVFQISIKEVRREFSISEHITLTREKLFLEKFDECEQTMIKAASKVVNSLQPVPNTSN